MDRVLQTFRRDYIAAKEAGDKLILKNERTGETRELPKDASSWQRREAIKSLQEQSEPSKYDQPMSATSVPERDKPLPVPISGGILARKRATENAEHQSAEKSKRDRATYLADQERLAKQTANELHKLQLASESERGANESDGSGVFVEWSELVRRAESRASEGGDNEDKARSDL